MILRRRSRSMNGVGGGVGGEGGGKGAAARALFGSPRLLHSSSLPADGRAPGSETPLYATSPTSVLDASVAFASSPVDASGSGRKRRPWCDGCAGLADVLDCAADADADDDDALRERSVLAAVSTRRATTAPAACLVRSCSLDRRVKDKSSWLPLPAGRAAAAAEVIMEPSSEDYTCVISRWPNPRTVHIFGDRVVEGERESSPPASGSTDLLSL